MSSRPWRDIYPTDFWNMVVRTYQSGRLRSKSVTLGRPLRSIGQDKLVLPQQVERVTEHVRLYHDIPKTELSMFDQRIHHLDMIVEQANSYFRKYKISSSLITRGRNGEG